MNVRSVIFDFDGPINDSFREGLRRIRILCAMHDVEFTREHRRKLTELWGIPGRDLLIQGLGITEGLATEMYAAWERMDLQIPVPLVPGAKETLYWLRRNEFVSTLLTTRNRQNILEIFEKLDLAREFGVISTHQDVPNYRKPDPRVFGYTLEELRKKFGTSKEECIFVGDTPADIEAGHGAGIEILVVQTGPYLLKHAESHPVELGNILNSIDDLPSWVEEHHEGEITYSYE